MNESIEYWNAFLMFSSCLFQKTLKRRKETGYAERKSCNEKGKQLPLNWGHSNGGIKHKNKH